MTLSVVGLSHKTAPMDVRERVAFAEAEVLPILDALRGLAGIEESLLLSTCNRTELYLVTCGAPPVQQLLDLVGAPRGVPAAALAPWLFVHRGTAAVQHVLRVTAGLESMVVGEPQVLGQVRRAFEMARSAGNTGPVLNRLVQLSLAAGRQVRNETGLSGHALSVPQAALSLCQRALNAVHGRPVMVVGAGRISGLVIEAFGGAGARIEAVANRTLESARTLAARVGAQAFSLDAIGSIVGDVEIIVVCTGVREPIVTRDVLTRAGERQRPLLVIDLGIPRGVEATVAALPGVTLYALDDLATEGVLPAVPAEIVARADRLIEEAGEQFERWLASRAAVPLITALHSRAGLIMKSELARAQGRLRGLDVREREAVRAVLVSTVRKILHHPTVRLRESAARRDTRVLELASELFDLNGEKLIGEADR